VVVIVVVTGFVAVPWVMFALTVPLFVVLPALKVLVSPSLGPVKDAFSFSALAATAIVALRRKATRQPIVVDRPILVLLAAIFGLYLVNLGGLVTGKSGHGLAWAQGVRLFCEPLALLLAALTLRRPERSLRAAQSALIWSAAGCALFGLAQQALGIARLERLGYVYALQIRQVGSHLRSFGTLDDPFLYASFLLLGLSVLLVSKRLTTLNCLLIGIIGLGLAVSYVRTAAVVALCIVGLALGRRGHALAAGLIVLIAVTAAGTVFVLSSQQDSTQVVTVNPTTYLTLNGRTKTWRTEIGSAGNWPFGLGVAVIGTAATRAKENLQGKLEIGSGPPITVVDSGYLSLIADIGLLGLGVYLALLGRIVAVGWQATRRGIDSGWLAITAVVVIGVDALSRESFTGYPIAYLAMLLAGLACAAAQSRLRALGPAAR
jgi:hypothetical protein